MREHSVNSLNNFVSGWYVEDEKLFDDVINWFDVNPNVHQSAFFYDGEYRVIPEIRDALHTALDGSEELYVRYHKHLGAVMERYIAKYPLCNAGAPWTIIDSTNVQKCTPGAAYHKIHCERSTAEPPFSSRHLVFMTYLNTVEHGGETEFIHQNIKFKPERGLTLVWPADWTFSHRGLIAADEDKYIITGWFNYV